MKDTKYIPYETPQEIFEETKKHGNYLKYGRNYYMLAAMKYNFRGKLTVVVGDEYFDADFCLRNFTWTDGATFGKISEQ